MLQVLFISCPERFYYEDSEKKKKVKPSSVRITNFSLRQTLTPVYIFQTLGEYNYVSQLDKALSGNIWKVYVKTLSKHNNQNLLTCCI